MSDWHTGLSIVLPLFSVMISIINSFTHDEYYDKHFPPRPTMVAFETFSIIIFWYQFFKYLRVWDSFNYLVRMIKEVIIDMVAFMIIFILVHLTFAEVFLFVSADSKNGFKFVNGFVDAFCYSWLTSLGSFNLSFMTSTDIQQPNQDNNHFVLMWILVMLCQVMTLIVMLNLLIAIVSERYIQVSK